MEEIRPPKQFCLFKHGHHAPHGWKSRNICNAYFKDGKVALRCPLYKSRCENLTQVINKIRMNDADYDETWKTSPSFMDSNIPKAFLRRNTLKVRLARPIYNQKKNDFVELLRTNPQQVRTKKYVDWVRFSNHLESLHGYNTDDIITYAPDPFASTSAALVPRTSQSYAPFQQNPSRAPSRQSQFNQPQAFARPQQILSRAPSVQSQIPEQHSFAYPQRISSRAPSRLAELQQRQLLAPQQQRVAPPQQRPLAAPILQSQIDQRRQPLIPAQQRSYSALPSHRVQKPKAIQPPPPSKPSREIVLFDTNTPPRKNNNKKSRYEGLELEPYARPPSRFAAIQAAEIEPTPSIDELLSFGRTPSIISSFLSDVNENALMRSFYTRYHINHLDAAEDERDFKDIYELSRSDLVNQSIANPPPNGLKFREYTEDEFERMRPSTKKLLREWKESLAPAFYDDYDIDVESGYEDDGEEAYETWNRYVQEAKMKSRKRHRSTKPSLQNTSTANESSIMVQKTVTTTKRKRTTMPSSNFNTPTPNKSSTILKTPSTVELFKRINSSSETPVRRSPRNLKAVCYRY